MSEHNRFQPGDRVRMTDSAVVLFLDGQREDKKSRGTVIGTRNSLLVVVETDDGRVNWDDSSWWELDVLPHSPAWLEAAAYDAAFARP